MGGLGILSREGGEENKKKVGGHVHPEELGFGKLFEKIRDAVIVADANTGRIVLWNSAATTIFGYSSSEALELSVENLVPERFKAQHHAGMTRYRQTGKGSYIDANKLLDLPALAKTGNEIRVELSLSPISPVDDRGALYVLATVRDVTDRDRLEKKLKANEERFRLLIEGVKDYAIFMLDSQGRVVSWNEGAHRIKGYHQQQILGRHFSIFYPEEDIKRGKPERELEIAKEKGTYEEEGWRLRKDGSRFWASVLITALRGKGGDLRGFSKVTRDISERKQGEEEIRTLNKILEKRVAERTAQLADREQKLAELVGKLIEAQEEERLRIAHDMHDGLTQLATATHLNLQAFASGRSRGLEARSDELDRALDLARQTAEESRRLIEGLRPAALDDFGLSTALRQLAERLEKEGWEVGYEEALGEKRLPPQVETAFYRVAQEALTNVRKHAQTTRVHLTLTCGERKILLTVRDEGCGFDPTASSKEQSKTGERVGLYGMQERLALLGGRLEIRSKPGAGTLLAAEVPLPSPGPEEIEDHHAG